MTRKGAAALLVLISLVAWTPASSSSPAPRAVGVEIVGVFAAGAPLNGAMLSGDRFYVTTADRLSIFDVSDPILPVLLASRPSASPINGEQISTNDELLLLNSYTSGRSLDVWNVEDASNPVVVGTVRGVPDEHVSCVLDCSWAYGSEGTVIDLRRPHSPDVIEVNWRRETKFGWHVHRVDEIRRGLIAVAPRGPVPAVIDVRDPRAPRMVGRASGVAFHKMVPHLHSYWPLRGHGRHLLASVEGPPTQRCREEEEEGVLVSFDTKGPRSDRFPLVDRYVPTVSRGCTGLYISEHPRFATKGLLAVAVALDGMRIVKLDGDGRFTEVASFQPVIADVWHSYWVDEEILYVPNATGEVYILRYTP